jgi:gag-polypeptide of LTR copia-type
MNQVLGTHGERGINSHDHGSNYTSKTRSLYTSRTPRQAEAWNVLSRAYEAKGPLSKVLTQRKLFWAKCKEGGDIEEFLQRSQGYKMEQANLEAAVADDKYGITVLMTLPDSWIHLHHTE